MSLCDGCGGEWGHSPGCPVEAAYSIASDARREASAPLQAEIERLKGVNRRLRQRLTRILESRDHSEAKIFARAALADE